MQLETFNSSSTKIAETFYGLGILDTLPKTNMESENHPNLNKEKHPAPTTAEFETHLATLGMYRFYASFQ